MQQIVVWNWNGRGGRCWGCKGWCKDEVWNASPGWTHFSGRNNPKFNAIFRSKIYSIREIKSWGKICTFLAHEPAIWRAVLSLWTEEAPGKPLKFWWCVTRRDVTGDALAKQRCLLWRWPSCPDRRRGFCKMRFEARLKTLPLASYHVFELNPKVNVAE